ncbi:MAG TPA: TIGR03790 family protein [Tepidisphaeraceae bacterium]|nr:TIGR03790 family protein [Tepidisphaeraceae bacterium]
MMNRPRTSARLCWLVPAMLLAWSGASAALAPDQIALIVNANVPAGKWLAEFYASQRHIPAGRIIELNLPARGPGEPAEDLSPDEYDQKVIPVVRGFLTARGLEKKVTCLVTFWGVPLRIDRRGQTPADAKEQADLKQQLEALKPTIEAQVKHAEALARELNRAYQPPGTSRSADPMTFRAQSALNDIIHQIETMADEKKRGEAFDRMLKLVRELVGEPTVTEKLSLPGFAKFSAKPPGAAEMVEARKHLAAFQKELSDLEKGPQSPETRAKLRGLFKSELGTLNTAKLLLGQLRMLDVGESEAAFDSELSLLWFGPYPKARWEPNTLYWRYAGKLRPTAMPIMVMRLDAPSERIVHQMIATSITIEKKGLKGQVLLDARGKPASDPYGVYDQTLRNLADLLAAKTKLTVILDNKEPLFPAHSQKDIALYCGWYSLRHYVPPGQFNAGAVGFHVASSEMVSLHNPGETGWCVGLLKDGVAATLGPVAEPYLQSFPRADEFFPLLLTGKIPLAEVYWKTTPMVSWMQDCVGDPLYTPYKSNPALKAADLPEGMGGLAR